MAHNSYIRPGGIWNAGQVVFHEEFAALDAAQYAAISGDAGGTWAPAAQITIGGAGVQLLFAGSSTIPSGAGIVSNAGSSVAFSGDFSTYGNFFANAATTFGASSAVTIYNTVHFQSTAALTQDAGCAWTLSGSVAFGGALHGISGSVATFDGSVIFGSGGTAAFSGTTTFSGTTGFFAAAAFSGTATFSGSASTFTTATNLNGPVALANVAQCSGTGRVVKRVATLTTGSAITSYGPRNVDVLYVSPTADLTLTIDDTGAVDGEEIRIINLSTSHLLTVNDPSNGTFIALKTLSGFQRSVLAQRVAGSWMTEVSERIP